MPLLIAALLALSAALIVLYPLLGLGRDAATQTAPAQMADAAERERLARQALREVEFDYTLGNLEASDYEELRERYELRALAALKTRYQREQELDALIERQLDALRQTPSAAAPTTATTATTATAARPKAAAHAPAEASAKTAPATMKPAPQRHSATGASSVRDRRAPKRRGS